MFIHWYVNLYFHPKAFGCIRAIVENNRLTLNAKDTAMFIACFIKQWLRKDKDMFFYSPYNKRIGKNGTPGYNLFNQANSLSYIERQR